MTNNHGRTDPETPLTAPEVKAPTHAERARTLVEGARTGTLSTLSNEGYPHGSFVTFALIDGDPIFLVSKLATHTQNLLGDGRASLLVHEPLGADPLAAGRVTLIGDCAQDDDGKVREAFLIRHPNAAYYVDFSDFAFWRLKTKNLRYIGGYGRMSWVEGGAFSAAEADPLASSADEIVAHMNDDHTDAVLAYARAFSRATDADDATLVAVDRYGFELSVKTERGPRPARIAFDSEVLSGDGARKAFIAKLKEARNKLGDRASFAPVKRREDGAKELGVHWLRTHLGEHRLIDIRASDELSGPLGALDGIEHIPLGDLQAKVSDWDRVAPILLLCRSGNRSGRAAIALEAMGFENAVSIRGGMKDWRATE